MIRFRHTLVVAAIAVSSILARPRTSPAASSRGGRGIGRAAWPVPLVASATGGPGGSILGLAQFPAVQEELKLKDPQKTKIRSLVESADQRRRQLREQMNPQGQSGQDAGQGGNGRRGRNIGNNDDQAGGEGGPDGQNGGGFGGQNGSGFGGQNGGYGGYGGLGGYGGYGGLGGYGGYGGLGALGGYGGYGGLGGYGGYGQYGGYGGQNGGGGQGNARGPDPAMAERFAAMREAQMELDESIEQALASILDRGQYRRLKQIQLQAEGIGALLQPDMIEKLNLEEDQVQQIRELLDQGRQGPAARTGGPGLDMMRTAFSNQGNNGPNPGGGGPGGPNFRDPAFQEAMKTFMEKPEVKAKMERNAGLRNAKIQDQLAAAVNRVLSKRQAAAYKKMLGAPFDFSQGRAGPGRGPGNRPAGAKPSDRADSAGKAKASGSDEDEAATSKSTSKSKGSDANAKAKRKNLRQQRGLDE